MSSSAEQYITPITDDIIDAAEHDRGTDLYDELKKLTHHNPRLALRGLARAAEGGLDDTAFLAGVAFAERAIRQRDEAQQLSGRLALDTTILPNDYPAA